MSAGLCTMVSARAVRRRVSLYAGCCITFDDFDYVSALLILLFFSDVNVME